jgi:hypothetical protein
MIPKELIAPKYTKDGLPHNTNITGMYRLCEEALCETYISCPYMRCFKHWVGMIDKKLTDAKEWTD